MYIYTKNKESYIQCRQWCRQNFILGEVQKSSGYMHCKICQIKIPNEVKYFILCKFAC